MESVNGKDSRGKIMVELSIKHYLLKLEAEEAAKPRGAKKVPSVAELAEVAGVSRGAMYNLVNGQVRHVNLNLLSAIINELRRRGFAADISDLLTTHPAELVEASWWLPIGAGWLSVRPNGEEYTTSLQRETREEAEREARSLIRRVEAGEREAMQGQ